MIGCIKENYVLTYDKAFQNMLKVNSTEILTSIFQQ